MQGSSVISRTSIYIKWFVIIMFSFNFNLHFFGCLSLSVAHEIRFKDFLFDKMTLLTSKATRTKLEQTMFENSSHLHGLFEIITDINERNSMLGRTKNFNFNRKANTYRSKKHIIKSASKRKKHRNKSGDKTKNFGENHESLIRKHKANDITVNRLPNRRLCPVWPTDPNMVVNCSNGRRIRSLCTVDCVPGFQLRKGSPSKRRCLSSRKNGLNNSKSTNPSWSRKDEQYACVSVCDDLPNPENGRVECGNGKVDESISTFASRSCVVTCDPGFMPSHSATRYCLNNGTWAGDSIACQAASLKVKRGLFVPHQNIDCGNVHSLTTFTYQDITFLVAGDMTGKQIRVYRWNSNQFIQWQIIDFWRPFVVEVNPSQRKYLWLLVGNRNSTAFYRMNAEKKFEFVSSSEDFFIATKSNSKFQIKGLNFLRTNGDIYRCKGNHSKRGRSIIFVQKLIMKRNRRPSFKRIMRKKMRNGDTLMQCALFFLNDKLYTATSINNRNGDGKVLFGVAQKKRMRITSKITQAELRNISDLEIFSTSNEQKMLVVSQTVSDGKCFLYRKNTDEINGG